MTEARETVLVVDDVPENLDILVQILKDTYRVRVAANGERALKLATSKEPPDLILLDIMMPGMDGFEVCRQLKTHKQLVDVPVIFISALDQVQDKVNAFTSGGVDYVTKPFQAAEVEARVATHLALRRQKRELQESYEKLRELEDLRDNLVHMIVHDMRSPLTGVVGMLELLQMDLREVMDEEQTTDMEEVRTSARTLVDMVSSLLDVSRMEAGEMPLRKKECDLSPVAEEALASLLALLKRCDVGIEPPSSKITADCDPEIIRRVIANLVGNAIKFTPPTGKVRVQFAMAPDYTKVMVSDTGPGIPPEYRDKIFEKFGQVEGRQQGQKLSTGLGLTFCKMAVEAHGGEIGVDSVLGQGSTFWFTLPALTCGTA